MSKQDMQEKIRLHSLWISKNTDGVCADFSNAYLCDFDFSHMNLSHANFENADLRNAVFRRANLFNANFSKANMRGVDMYGSDCSAVNFKETNLHDVDFHEANLSNAILEKADLQNTNFMGTNLEQTILDNKPICSFQFNQHSFYYYGGNEIQIDCKKYPLKGFIAHGHKLGEALGYSDLEIETYRKFVELCLNFFREIK